MHRVQDLRTMDRRTFLGYTLGAVGSLALVACGQSVTQPAASPSVVRRPTIRVAGGDFGFPSPFAYVRGPGYWLMSYIYDTLLWKDSTGKQLPWLASSYTRSEDGLTYTFHLRDGIHWHDGQLLTVDDVVFTFEYYASQHLSPQIFVRPIEVADVKASGPQTVEIRLAKPIVTFVGAVAGALPIVPRHIWASIPDAFHAQDPKLLVGSGAYRLTSYVRGEGAYLYDAFDGYFLGRPFVKRIENRPVGDELTALLAGDIDAAEATGPQPDALAPFHHDPSYGILKGPEDFTLALYWNLARGGALADRTFRQACCHAINRQDIVQRLIGGNGAPGNPGFLPPTNPYYVPVEQYPYDPSLANQMLDAAGYKRASSSGPREAPDGKPLRFGILVGNNPVPPVTDLVVTDLRAIGVQLDVQPVDRTTLDARTTKGDYDMAITNFGGLGGDPDYLRQVYSSKVPKRFQSAQGYVNPEFDRIADQQLVTLDDTARRRLIAEMQEIVARDVPLLPLYYPRFFHVYRKAVFDAWYFTPGGFASGIPTVFNKQAFITGRTTGESIRPAQ